MEGKTTSDNTVIHIKDKNHLEEILEVAGERLVVVDFTATWCGPCRFIAPVFESLAGEFPDIIFVKVDVDENDDIAAEYGVQAMPTFVFIRNKDKLDDVVGASVNNLKEKLLVYRQQFKTVIV